MRALPRLTFVFAVALFTSCDNATAPPVPAIVGDPNDTTWARLGQSCGETSPVVVLQQARRDSVAPPGSFRTIDDDFAEAARTLPGGFGGFFLAFDRINVLLVDTTKLAESVAWLKPQYPSSQLNWNTAQPLRARWDFAQLYDWYRYLNAYHTWRTTGVISSDINEKYNRLEYGVLADSVRNTLETRLKTLGLPCYLVAIRVEAPFTFGSP